MVGSSSESQELTMGSAGRRMEVKSLLAVALGTVGCYCLYRVLSDIRKRRYISSMLDEVPRLTVLTNVSERSPETQSENLPASSNKLEPSKLKSLLEILSRSSDFSIQQQILTTLFNSAAFSENHDIIRNFNGIHVIGNFLSHPIPKTKTTALNALNNLCVNLQNQEQIQAFMNVILKDISKTELNSDVQLAGLRLLTNMVTTNNYHERMVDYIPNLLNLLEKGNDETKIQILKILGNLCLNPSMTVPLLTSKAPKSLILFFDDCIKKDILLRLLAFTSKLAENLVREWENGVYFFTDDSLYAVLLKDPSVLKRKLELLLSVADFDVKVKIDICVGRVEKLAMYAPQ